MYIIIILKTKILTKNDTNLVYYEIEGAMFNCNNTMIIGQNIKTYQDPNHPGDNNYYKTYASYTVYNINTLDSIDSYTNARGIRVSKTCKYYATATGDPTYGVEVYDLNTKQLLHRLPVNGPSITGIEFSPDDKYLVTSPTIKLWNMETGKEDYSYQSGSANNIATSHDGNYIFSTIGRYLYKWYTRWGGVSVKGEENPSTPIIFPNPSSGTATVQFTQPFSEETNIIISNINGLIIKQISSGIVEAGNQIIPFNTIGLSSGTYYVKVQNTNLSLTFKLIVNK